MADTITSTELFREIQAGTVTEILDVRSTDDFRAGKVEGPRPVPTRHVPVYRVMEELEEQAAATREGAVIVCGQGNGSELVAEEFEALGVRTRSLAGGTDAWNRLLVPVEITGLPGDVRVWQFQRPAKACLSYLVGVPGGNAVIVDPTRSPDAYLELAQVHDMAVTHVVDTHVHADHISGGPAVAARLGAEYHLPPEDAGGIVPFPNRPLKDGDQLDLGSAVVRAMTMHLPGHTPGTTALLVSETVLLVGDTVFVRGLGRPDLTGQADELARDLFRSVHERLRPLDPRTIIAPAHWSTSEEINADGLVTTTLEEVFTATLLNERAIERFVEQIVSSLPAAPQAYDTIRRVNAGQITPGDDEIEVLDVGRNQCAASTSLTATS
ncbi:MBL fold metallo-hydrolase [Rhodococcus opacus]|uniref:MBL fold metallo-hydrolase n=1 Tax=Rhodococcus opacus TaxID=37919 RepID=UPI0002A25DB5|nr:MBL fold metallo-hydrolase [Rhodococcus opacus]ELB87932.1 hydroxyacylglutathione hydrolase [Rhodococcus wratislaviensis IFP 2016]MBA8959217.1 glyoxylase-like metal-dependent hydrolase (beta-lactamase superfamily II) [Rhodococcus opacus]MBP2204782.1 glyoxylase-like metal-dependent hydrolase (beta-lactamase superfamily II) [Rhodococcus opacus]MDV6241345.1 MBL fold metallo-hydrolase [Rhodococcus opacus]MDX5969820.1 MBL fold metallo-hydrolase [Rhodococcus opacus]